MSELDLTGLRKVAEAASHPCAEWELSMASDGPGSIRLTSPVGDQGSPYRRGADIEPHLRVAAFDPATVLALLDRLEAAEAAEDEHDQCPAQCPVCSDWATRTPCDHCKGSGCGPGTALGGYEECEWCAGMGWLHEGCRDTGPSWQERAETERDEAREEQR